jgi:hypothetical protein
MPKKSQTEERFSWEKIKIRGMVIVFMSVRSDPSFQKTSEMPQFHQPSKI